MADVRYLSIDGELVSAEWYSFLSAARRDGVAFHVNEGHRTWARQVYFYNCYKCQCCNGGNLAAVPSNNAPHIRTGRIDHAIDVDGSEALIAYGAAHGVKLTRTVRGESWHLEASAEALRAFHAAVPTRDPYAALTDEERRLVGKLFYHRKKMAAEKRSGLGPKFAAQLGWARWYKAKLQARANLLYALGKAQGWAKLRRGTRQKIIRGIVDDGSRKS